MAIPSKQRHFRMMKRIVVSQPMYFPWVGLFEQVRLADTYVHLTDVQLSKGRSFVSRVQIKTKNGIRWLTVPLRRTGTSRIDRAVADTNREWRRKHLRTLECAYAKSPFADEMLAIVQRVLNVDTDLIAELNCFGIELVASYFELQPEFLQSNELEITSSRSERLVDIMSITGGTIYVTGHGARNYLDHELFVQNDLDVEYMNYEKHPWNQLHGEFTPYVSILDLVANVGKRGSEVIKSGTTPWREFVA